MATNFFERQDRARQSTAWLIGWFLVGLVSVVVLTSALIGACVYAGLETQDQKPDMVIVAGAVVLTAICTALLIGLGSLYKVWMLRSGGGRSVAESLGGTLLHPDARDPGQRKLLNVVEEMAIASGVPVPPVFLLKDEEGINAFAAGYTPSDAVIGVTQGAIEKLNREQLQGVMAHEFSHILNGDMRLGIRLIGVLHGILLLGLTGRILFRMMAYSGRGRSSSRGGGQAVLVMLAVGAALMLVGAFGSFFGSLIKAAVSRQREYLADAAAVQFTRNPKGLAGALKRIGAIAHGGVVQSGSASEASHLFFTEGVGWGFASWMATHPPLPKRILAIDPQWDGTFPAPESFLPHERVSGLSTAALAGFSGEPEPAANPPQREPAITPAAAVGIVAASELQAAVQRMGDPSQSHAAYAQQLLARIPPKLREAAHDAFGCRALVFALLLDRDEEVLRSQLRALQTDMEPAVVQLTVDLAGVTRGLEPNLRLPLIDMAIPALQSMSKLQFEKFEAGFWALVKADTKMDLFEWVLAQVLVHHLRSRFGEVARPYTKYYGLQRLDQHVSMLMSMLAHVGHDEETSRKACQLAAPFLPDTKVQWIPRAQCKLSLLEKALQELRLVSPKLKEHLMDACTAIVCADGVVKPAEAELLRGVGDLLDCPVPPILPGQSTEKMANLED